MKAISRILIFAMIHLCWLTSHSYAEIIPTESAAQSQAKDDRQRILDLLDHQEVEDELEKHGISKVEAAARVNSLTDEEVTEIAGKLDKLPAGGFYGVAAAILAAAIVFTGMFWCAIREPFCWVFDCEMRWNKCVSYVANYGLRKKDGNAEDYDESPPWFAPESSKENKIKSKCYSSCNSIYHSCINSDNESSTSESQCETEKNSCFQKCEGS